jgi:hypothetical protein
MGVVNPFRRITGSGRIQLPRKLSRGVRLLVMTAVAALAIGAAPAAASACEFPQTTQAFSQFGDTSDYYLAPGGDFETGAWDLGGARLVFGNDPFGLAPGSRMLRLGEEDWARSPAFCVSKDTPHLRFVAKADGRDDLEVTVRVWRNGRVVDYERSTVSSYDHRSWAPSRNVSLRTDAFVPGDTALVTVELRTDDSGWYVDNVFIDPFRR